MDNLKKQDTSKKNCGCGYYEVKHMNFGYCEEHTPKVTVTSTSEETFTGSTVSEPIQEEKREIKHRLQFLRAGGFEISPALEVVILKEVEIARADLISTITERLEREKKSVRELFPDTDIATPTEDLAIKCLQKDMHNSTLDKAITIVAKIKNE